MSLGSQGDDVKQLQIILRNLNFLSTKIQVTNYYGFLTKKALANLQKYYDRLPYNKIYNLKPYPGLFGTQTRRFFNDILLTN